MPTSENVSREKSILAVWATSLTDEALAAQLERLVREPKGWKKDQKNALILEAALRLGKRKE